MAKEIHGRQICAYLFLSSPQREIQVKREELLEYAQSGINGERSEIAEIEAASTGEAARLRAALRRAAPDAIRQHHQIYTGLHRPVLIRAEQQFFHFGPRPS
ncbi:hypothetical protein ZEAMMB73_Zm00001d039934 [Zea mays]|uniref:Uncharacterized protein n=1 Tax=Zea mays TaxID=4577 RepID=A0A1D6MLV6_MAIZE|nr:hypothetical protein ZEAMMB73_Zm00001d039934 [Zea mays]